MKISETFSNITFDTLKHLVERYNTDVPPNLQKLEEVRLREIPETLRERRKDGDSFLEKSEFTALVEWKLYDPL